MQNNEKDDFYGACDFKQRELKEWSMQVWGKKLYIWEGSYREYSGEHFHWWEGWENILLCLLNFRKMIDEFLIMITNMELLGKHGQ